MTHPGATWAWAGAAAAVALGITNPIALAAMLAALLLVVAAHQDRSAPHAQSLRVLLAIGVFVTAARFFLLAIFPPAGSGPVIVTLPAFRPEGWLTGMTIGGPIYVASVIAAAYDSLRLFVVLAACGSAVALTSPSRLISVLPGALYEFGVSAAIGVSLAPAAHASATAQLRMRRLRGKPTKGPRAWLAVARPMLDETLDRAADMAASMDSRGFGRAIAASPMQQRLTRTAMWAGLALVGWGVAELGFGSAPRGWLGVGVGIAAVIASMWARGQRSVRTRYQKVPWRSLDWALVLAGLGCVAGVVVDHIANPDSLRSAQNPLEWPTVPVLALLGAAALAAPALLATTQSIRFTDAPSASGRPRPMSRLHADASAEAGAW